MIIKNKPQNINKYFYKDVSFWSSWLFLLSNFLSRTLSASIAGRWSGDTTANGEATLPGVGFIFDINNDNKTADNRLSWRSALYEARIC